MTAIAFQTRLKSDNVHIPDVEKLIGKEVIITVIEIEKEAHSGKRRWHYLGTDDLGKKLDNVNIRDFAHE